MSTVTPPTPLVDAGVYGGATLLEEARNELRGLIRYRELLRHLVRAALARESTGTVFGSVWWLLDPLILMGVYVVFVDVILKSGGDNYALFVFIGVTAWKQFSSGITGGIVST